MGDNGKQKTLFDAWKPNKNQGQGQPQAGPSRGFFRGRGGGQYRGPFRGGRGGGRGGGTSSGGGRGRGGGGKGSRGGGRGRGGKKGTGNPWLNAAGGPKDPPQFVNLSDEDDEDFVQIAGEIENNNKINETFEKVNNATKIPGFDKTAGELWIYPTNQTVREYQFKIVETALFHNTLVCLPTGLGKTFIAAVVMFNFHRWFPNDLIIFMAPTRPLVTQQLEACHSIVGIKEDITIELTGQTAPKKREEFWATKSVFFLTPQVLLSDLQRGSVKPERIKCVVVDEAHKALGNHADAQVIQFISQKNKFFRVLALSATPGSDLAAVKQVFENLLISKVEIRTEESNDLAPYIHQKQMETRVVYMDPFLESIYNRNMEIFQFYTGRLMRKRFLYARDANTLSQYQLIMYRNSWRSSRYKNMPKNVVQSGELDYCVCISLVHALDLLLHHGLRSYHSYFSSLLNGDKGNALVVYELKKNPTFDDMLDEIQLKLNLPDFGSAPDFSKSDIFGDIDEDSMDLRPDHDIDYLASHPKMKLLRDIVKEHFEKCKRDEKSTRIMIFSSYRDSVQEIGGMLKSLRPLVKPMSFIGQADSKSGGKGLKQKQQVEVLERFRRGGFNVLVATCVGEEGLDIGEVDLIICFDANQSPTRLVQRMGRTGRKREGRIMFLLTKGKEEMNYNKALTKQSSISKNITDMKRLESFLYKSSPRMVPPGLEPKCFKMSLLTTRENRMEKLREEMDYEIDEDSNDSFGGRRRRESGPGSSTKKSKNKIDKSLTTLTQFFVKNDYDKARESFKTPYPTATAPDPDPNDEYDIYGDFGVQYQDEEEEEDEDFILDLFDIPREDQTTIQCFKVPALPALPVIFGEKEPDPSKFRVIRDPKRLDGIWARVQAMIHLNSENSTPCKCGKGNPFEDEDENADIFNDPWANSFELDPEMAEALLALEQDALVKSEAPEAAQEEDDMFPDDEDDDFLAQIPLDFGGEQENRQSGSNGRKSGGKRSNTSSPQKKSAAEKRKSEEKLAEKRKSGEKVGEIKKSQIGVANSFKSPVKAKPKTQTMEEFKRKLMSPKRTIASFLPPSPKQFPVQSKRDLPKGTDTVPFKLNAGSSPLKPKTPETPRAVPQQVLRVRNEMNTESISPGSTTDSLNSDGTAPKKKRFKFKMKTSNLDTPGSEDFIPQFTSSPVACTKNKIPPSSPVSLLLGPGSNLLETPEAPKAHQTPKKLETPAFDSCQDMFASVSQSPICIPASPAIEEDPVTTVEDDKIALSPDFRAFRRPGIGTNVSKAVSRLNFDPPKAVEASKSISLFSTHLEDPPIEVQTSPKVIQSSPNIIQSSSTQRNGRKVKELEDKIIGKRSLLKASEGELAKKEKEIKKRREELARLERELEEQLRVKRVEERELAELEKELDKAKNPKVQEKPAEPQLSPIFNVKSRVSGLKRDYPTKETRPASKSNGNQIKNVESKAGTSKGAVERIREAVKSEVDYEAIIVDSDEDDFQPVRQPKRCKLTKGREKIVKGKSLKRKKSNPFIDDEAVLSGNEGSEDEVELEAGPGQNRYIEDSFVTNEVEKVGETQHANYLNAPKIRSPPTPQLFKKVCKRNWEEFDDDEYERNSFCDDDVSYEEVGDFTQAMNDAKKAVDEEKKSGAKRKLRRK